MLTSYGPGTLAVFGSPGSPTSMFMRRMKIGAMTENNRFYISLQYTILKV